MTYAVAIAAPWIALLVRLPFGPLLKDQIPYITFFLATAASASYGGFGPGIVSTVLGGILAQLFVIQHSTLSVFGDSEDRLGIAFLIAGAAVSFLAGRLREATLHENALRLLFQQTLVSLGDAVISMDDEQKVRLMNPAAETLTGWKQENAKGRAIADVFRIVREDTSTQIEVPFQRIFESETRVDLQESVELIRRNGSRVPIDFSGAPIRDEKGALAGAVLVFRDISQRRKAELELGASERRASAILASISDGFVLLNPEWQIIDLNASAEDMLDRQATSLLGKNLWEAIPEILGTEIEVALKRAIHDGTSERFEYEYQPQNRWFDVSAYPSDEGLAVYLRDITERKLNEADLVRLNEDLRHFTFAATHDFREPLRMISIFSQMLDKQLNGNMQARKQLDNVQVGVRRLERLVDALITFARTEDAQLPEPTAVSAETALKEAMDSLRAAIAETRAVVTFDPLPTVLCNDVQLAQVFQNVIANAIKYRASDTPPHIHIRADKHNPRDWRFSVQDNGIGIQEEFKERIFQPFKRLHGSEIEGAGIGLATCRRIIERYGGRIWVTSTYGHGATFHFLLGGADSPDRGVRRDSSQLTPELENRYSN